MEQPIHPVFDTTFHGKTIVVEHDFTFIVPFVRFPFNDTVRFAYFVIDESRTAVVTVMTGTGCFQDELIDIVGNSFYFTLVIREVQ